MTDNTQFPDLTRRQEEILSLVVRSYTQKPDPVSSKFLKETYGLGYSSATIRNELAALDEMGYIVAPHSSSGRVPTEQGYRYFVRRLLDGNSLTPAEQAYISERIESLPTAMEQWLRGAAKQLARTVQIASLVTPPAADLNRFKHVELISIQGRLCLMVLVTQSGLVHQQMLNLAEPLSQTALSEAASRVNSICAGLDANEVRRKGIQSSTLDRDICELAADLMERADRNRVRVVYRDGLSEVVTSFNKQEGTRQVLRVFEENAVLDMILADVIPTDSEPQDVQVIIGGDGRWEELSHLTMVLSRYGIPGQATGTLGVLGPTHIDYARAIGAVSYMAELMSSMLRDLYGQDDTDSDNPRLP
ncbi:MAG: heat-inducible transcriptional repressor HrcA [Chloroflexota bacterium]